MIHSMTGFGKAQLQLENKKITIEIRSLNSKQLDLNVKMPGVYREKELELRKYVASKIIRGKVELSIFVENTGVDQNFKINQPLVQSYISDLKLINPNVEEKDLIAIAMRMPEVMRTEREELNLEEWLAIMKGVNEAIAKLQEFRRAEGTILESEFLNEVSTIEAQMEEVLKYEEERIITVKERILGNLEKLQVETDSNRFEQELIYYIEKLDITEEKVRLKGHCDYFRKTIEHSESNGRKLGFIGQEMGREINTMGSKANHAEIQKCVVLMKDSLEKIKEQILNVL